MKNGLSDLNNHLFCQLERLGDEKLNEDELQNEIERGKAISAIAKDVISNASLVLDAAKLKAEYQGVNVPKGFLEEKS